jgi:cytochrome c
MRLSAVVTTKWYGKLAAVLFVGALVLSACDGPGPERGRATRTVPLPGFIADAASGKTLFETSCAVCHGVSARGTQLGPPLVHKIYEPSHHADMSFQMAVHRGVRQHHWPFGDMPPVPGLSAEDVGHIIAYVRQEQRRAGIN